MTDQSTTSRRAEYMSGALTHHDYYGLLVELLGEDALRELLPTRSERLTPPAFREASGDRTPLVLERGKPRTPTEWRELLAADDHLNNVWLRRWDARHRDVLALVRRADRDALLAITGSGGWSLGDSVCVLKTTARRYAQSDV
jgi:hypothetical protein